MPLSSHVVTEPRPVDASFESQPTTRAAGSYRANQPRPEDATSTRSNAPASIHQADMPPVLLGVGGRQSDWLGSTRSHQRDARHENYQQDPDERAKAHNVRRLPVKRAEGGGAPHNDRVERGGGKAQPTEPRSSRKLPPQHGETESE